MNENNVNQAPSISGDGDPLHGQAVDLLSETLRQFSPDGMTIQPQTAPQATSAVPVTAPAVPTTPAVPTAPTAPTVSTDPIGDLSNQFSDPVTQVAQAPAVPEALTAPDVDIPTPQNLDESATYTWQKLKAERKEYRDLARQLQQQVEASAKSGEAIAAERAQFADKLQKLEARNAELEDKLGKASFAESPEFREKYTKQLNQAAESMANTLKESISMDESTDLNKTVRNLLTVDDAEFNRLVSKLPLSVQGSLLNNRLQYKHYAEQGNAALAEWRKTQQGLKTVAEQENTVRMAEHRGSLAKQAIEFSQVMTPMDKRLSIFSEPTYKDDVAKADESFRSFMQAADESAIARAAYVGYACMPIVQRQLAYAFQALNEYKNAYLMSRSAGTPPMSPMNIVSSAPQVSIAPKPAPVDSDGPRNFQSTVAATVDDTLRRVGLMR